MVVIQTETQSGIERQSTVIALFAIVCVVLSWTALNLELYLVATRILHRESVPMYVPELIEQLFWLCPVLVLILFRRVVRIIVPYAVIFFIIFAGHCYYLLKFHLVGANAFQGAFQWTSLLQSIAGRISVGVFGLWIIIRLTFFLSDALKNHNGAGSNG